MLTKFKQGLTALAVLAAALAAAPNDAAAAEVNHYVVVVHIGDGSHSGGSHTPETPEQISLSPVIWPNGSDEAHVINQVFFVDDEGAGGASIDAGGGGGGDRQPEQDAYGNTAAGLMLAHRSCPDRLGNLIRRCQVILVNYQAPEAESHRLAAIAAAEALMASGQHSLHTVAVTADGADATTGPEADLLRFNRELTRWAAIVADETNYVDGFGLLMDWIEAFVEGGPGLLPPGTWPINWDELSASQKVRSNPYRCDTAIEWIWASDGSCHAKAPELILPADWDQLSPADKVRANPYGCNTAVEWIWASDGTCHYKAPELVLPPDWDDLDYAERRQLNPYGCADHQWLRYWDGICDQVPYPIGRGGG